MKQRETHNTHPTHATRRTTTTLLLAAMALALLGSCGGSPKPQEGPEDTLAAGFAAMGSETGEEPIRTIDESSLPADFKDFFKSFKSDCEYQTAHVELPLTALVVEDEGIFETVVLKEWECIGAEVWAQYQYEYEQWGRGYYRAICRVEETGVLISYFFKLTEQGWHLTQLSDESM